MRTLLMAGLLVLPMGFALAGTENAAAVNKCGGVDTAIISCSEGNGEGGDIKNTGVWGILLLIINILVAGVAVLALAGIVYGIVLYTSAGGNAEQVKKAMGIFTNVVVGVIAFAGMYVLLNFLIPGAPLNDIL